MMKVVSFSIPLWVTLLSFVFWPVFGFFVILVMVNDNAADKFGSFMRRYFGWVAVIKIWLTNRNKRLILRWYVLRPFYWVICKLSIAFENTEDDVPIKAYKQALIIHFPDRTSHAEFVFGGLSGHLASYHTTDKAFCYRDSDHHAPDKDCKCGFHALRLRSLVGVAKLSWLTTLERITKKLPVFLEVELYGDIKEGTYGYRAERQRVMRVIIPARCVKCRFGRQYFSKKKTKLYSVLFTRGVINVHYILPLCQKHRYKDATSFTPQYIADGLGTEVVCK